MISSDLLHQVRKGVWLHLIDWFMKMLECKYDIWEANTYKDELDKQFAFVPPFSGIKNFHKGISGLGQMRAREHADIIKVCRRFQNYDCVFSYSYLMFANLLFVLDIFAMCSGIFFHSSYIRNYISN